MTKFTGVVLERFGPNESAGRTRIGKLILAMAQECAEAGRVVSVRTYYEDAIYGGNRIVKQEMADIELEWPK